MTDEEFDKLLTQACIARSNIHSKPDFSNRLVRPYLRRIYSKHLLLAGVASIIGILIISDIIWWQTDTTQSDISLYDNMLNNADLRFEQNKIVSERLREEINDLIPFPSYHE